MVAWTTPAQVVAALGTGAVDDPYLEACCDASNVWCFRKRLEAGYTDPAEDDAPAPSADVAMGATLYAVALWRERASVDGYSSFQEVGAWSPTGGSAGQINRLLGVPKAGTDTVHPADVEAWRRGRRRHLWRVQ